MENTTSRPTEWSALVLAGGFGLRLRPLTEATVKPMLPIGKRPLLELTIAQLADAGIRRIFVSTHYRAEQIRNHFTAEQQQGIDLRFLHETAPLGTAGSLGLLPPLDHPVLIVNGDVLCRLDYRSILNQHTESGADITVGVARYEHRLPYGVIESQGSHIVALREKPVFEYEISGGVYVLNPSVVKGVHADRQTDMPELITRALEERLDVRKYLITEPWTDIGDIEQYEHAQSAAESY